MPCCKLNGNYLRLQKHLWSNLNTFMKTKTKKNNYYLKERNEMEKVLI